LKQVDGPCPTRGKTLEKSKKKCKERSGIKNGQHNQKKLNALGKTKPVFSMKREDRWKGAPRKGQAQPAGGGMAAGKTAFMRPTPGKRGGKKKRGLAPPLGGTDRRKQKGQWLVGKKRATPLTRKKPKKN